MHSIALYTFTQPIKYINFTVHLLPVTLYNASDYWTNGLHRTVG